MGVWTVLCMLWFEPPKPPLWLRHWLYILRVRLSTRVRSVCLERSHWPPQRQHTLPVYFYTPAQTFLILVVLPHRARSSSFYGNELHKSRYLLAYLLLHLLLSSHSAVDETLNCWLLVYRALSSFALMQWLTMSETSISSDSSASAENRHVAYYYRKTEYGRNQQKFTIEYG